MGYQDSLVVTVLPPRPRQVRLSLRTPNAFDKDLLFEMTVEDIDSLIAQLTVARAALTKQD